MVTKYLPERIQYSLLVILLLLLGIYFLWQVIPSIDGGMYDFNLYVRVGEELRAGGSPYKLQPIEGQSNHIWYPLIFVIVFAPLTLIPVSAANYLWFLFSLVCLIAGSILTYELVRKEGEKVGTGKFVLLLIITFLFYPVWTNAKLGQTNSIFYFLVMASLLLIKFNRPIIAGALIAIAATIKFIPLIILFYALTRRQYIFVIIGTGVFILFQIVPAFWYPEIVTDYWQRVVPLASSHAPTGNISLVNLSQTILGLERGFLLGIVTSLSIVAVLVPIVLGLNKPYMELHQISLLIIATAIVGPLVEIHHLVWLILPLWFSLTQLIRQRRWYGIVIWFGAFLLLSQPFRLARVIERLTPIELPSGTLQGGVIMMVGVIILYALMLAVTLNSSPVPLPPQRVIVEADEEIYPLESR